MKFDSIIKCFEESYLTSYILISKEVYFDALKLSKNKRFICNVNSKFSLNCTILTKKTFYFILLNQIICKQYNLKQNDVVSIHLQADTSKYGMEISVEFEEVLKSDPDGEVLFEKLSDGKKRSLIYLITKTKNSNLKIAKAFVILDHLKRNKGKLDLQLLNEDFKNYRNQQKL